MRRSKGDHEESLSGNRRAGEDLKKNTQSIRKGAGGPDLKGKKFRKKRMRVSRRRAPHG